MGARAAGDYNFGNAGRNRYKRRVVIPAARPHSFCVVDKLHRHIQAHVPKQTLMPLGIMVWMLQTPDIRCHSSGILQRPTGYDVNRTLTRYSATGTRKRCMIR
eukprot:1193325-Prorocentrum_minimum.AAC.3